MLRLDILTLIKTTDPLGREEGPAHSLPPHSLLPLSLSLLWPLHLSPRSAGPQGPWRRDTAGIKMNRGWDATSLPNVSSPFSLLPPIHRSPWGPTDDTLTFEVVRPRERRDSHITINFVPLIKHMNVPMSRITWCLGIEQLYWILSENY